jgi:hypothetical protein
MYREESHILGHRYLIPLSTMEKHEKVRNFYVQNLINFIGPMRLDLSAYRTQIRGEI